MPYAAQELSRLAVLADRSLVHPSHAPEERPPLERWSMMLFDMRADVTRRIERAMTHSLQGLPVSSPVLEPAL